MDDRSGGPWRPWVRAMRGDGDAGAGRGGGDGPAAGRWAGACGGSRPELGCSHMTVRRYLAAGGWTPYRAPERASALDGLGEWLAERFRRHRGNADVVRQDLEREHGMRVSLRTVERAVAPLRRELAAEARATVRFETPPGHQMQVDFGELRVPVEGETGPGVPVRGHARAIRGASSCAPSATSGSRLGSTASRARSATSAGSPTEVLVDNAKALVLHQTRRRARCGSTAASSPTRATGGSGRAPARRSGPAPRERTRGASATSSATP